MGFAPRLGLLVDTRSNRAAFGLGLGLAFALVATSSPAGAQGFVVAPAGECAPLRAAAAPPPNPASPVAGPVLWRFHPSDAAAPAALPGWPPPAPPPAPGLGPCEEPGSGCLGPLRTASEPPPEPPFEPEPPPPGPDGD